MSRIAQAPMAVGLFALASGCASFEGTLRDPVTARCEWARLHECASVTEGVIAYADGDAQGARDKLARSTAHDTPESLRAFAASLNELGGKPEVREARRSLTDVAGLFAWQATSVERARWSTVPSAIPLVPPTPALEDRGPPMASNGKPTLASIGSGLFDAPPADLRKALTADTDPSRLDGGTQAMPAASHLYACLEAPSANGLCAKITDGALVVTDLHVACAGEVFVSAGKPGAAPRWSMRSSLAMPLVVHGSRLAVRGDESLYFGVPAESSRRTRLDDRCSVVWSGFRPYAAARDVPTELGY